MSFLVRFWGVRGSIPTPGLQTHRYGGNTSCVELEVDGVRFICDAGSGIRELGIDLMEEGPKPLTAHLFFSHMHWDHIQGFPFFTPVYVPNNHFTIWGPRTGDRRFARLLGGQMRSSYFPVDFHDLGGTISADDLGDGERVIDGVRVRVFHQHHPGVSFAYRFEKNGVSVVYATDSEIDLDLDDPELPLRDPGALRGVPQDLVAFCRGANLLIADGQYTDEEYPKVVGWGHARATTIVDLAVLAEVEQLAVFHHDPMHTDEEISDLIGHCQQRAASHGSDVTVFGAREGFELRLDRPPGRRQTQY
ncbi:MAG: MBL fold metallo-hydrolase [Myxococcales bacterium]|nr:MBL fold metallo-hydrolase [Myxococcales bacterium]